ncbi:hypothetical protein EFE32_13430 [Lactococcus lactis subsp. lactis]|uniref:hypothetical protein n=1 Tax=Lactococcus lactis TaxID=1358 RepID=UPI00223B501E|nr:hypothetical protein [Lactococcus lactis]MCT0017766.1 hypothetical protein [Lactococcus lactis subsp. lactis]
MKYFVTSLSASKNLGTMNWQTLILDNYHVDDSYWENAKIELSKEIEWVTQSELYKKLKRNDGAGNDIILSLPVSVILETVKSDFPNANVWVYQ